MVEEPVVTAAQGDAVSDTGGAVVGPVSHVVNVAPAGGYGTPGKSASTIPNNHGAADRGGHAATGPPDVEQLTPRAQHHGDDLSVAGEAPGDISVDRTT